MEVNRGLPSWRLAKYFEQLPAGWRLVPQIREMVKFQRLNLMDRWLVQPQFDIVFLRNVMIYFARELQRQVHDLFHDSLMTFGVLGLGSKESIRFSGREDEYEALDESCRLYRRVR